MIAPHSLFFILGLLLFACYFVYLEFRKKKSTYLLVWCIALAIYFLRITLTVISYSFKEDPNVYPAVSYGINLLFVGAFIVTLNYGVDSLLKLKSSKRENLFLSIIYIVISIFLISFEMESIWQLSISRFFMGLGYILLAFGFYRIWIVEKINLAKYLTAFFGVWGIVLPLTIVYVISLDVQTPNYFLESVFDIFFIVLLIGFINSNEKKMDTFLLAHLENIRENSDNFFLLLDKRSRILRISNSFADLFSLTPKKLQKTKFRDLIAPKNVDNFMEKWGKVNFGKDAEFDTNLNPAYSDKSEKRYKFLFKPIFDDSRLNCVSVLGKDISSQYKIDQTVKKITIEKNAVEHELEEFLSMASHELQSPLISLEGYVSALSHALKGVDLPDEVLKYPDFINKSVKKVSALIQAILDLSRANPKGTSVSAVDLNHVMARVEGDIFQQQGNAPYELNIEEKLPLVSGNLVQLSQLFLNLIMNGIKYSFPDRTPVINVYLAKKERTSITIAVQDNGIGIPEEHFNSIFSPMKRLHMREADGYGLGLTLVKKIVDSHQGTISVESKVNEGSTFFIKLKKYRKSEKK